ncbi:MAG: hypothetical protein EOO69_08305 [Moraxellaceae bacterium]|nr:MAG: hypothetical protein EOO69_08305 [Moraxellaceae bacterium]
MVLFLLPQSDYDPTECAVPWQALTDAGIKVIFATPNGQPAFADKRLVKTGFRLLNPLLMTRKPDLAIYQVMTQDQAFNSPLSYAAICPEAYAAIMIPGGHAAGMRSMLDSELAKTIVLHFFQVNKPVAAVCHGVLLVARTIDPATGQSVLFERNTTALLAFPMELPAWVMTYPWLGNYYRTYPITVEAEVKATLKTLSQFKHGPLFPIRDSKTKPKAGFITKDKNYLSARWPGDCHRFAQEFVKMVQARQA